MFNILNGYAVGVYLSRARLEMHGMKENSVQKQCFGSGSGLYPDDPNPDSESASGSRRAKMTRKNRKKLRKFRF
jgi:hypothetical protein